MAIYRVVVLQRINEPSDFSMRIALRAQVPAARRQFHANPDAVSAWDGEDDQAMIDGLKSGLYVEQVRNVPFLTEPTEVQMANRFTAEWDDFQANVTGYNPWTYTGTRWDGSSWTVVRVS